MDAYTNPRGPCQPQDVLPSEQSELELELQLGLKKRKLDDADFNDEDELNMDNISDEDLKNMRQFQKHLLPADLIETDARYMEYLFNATHPESSTLRCPICYHNHERYHLQSRYLSDFAKENGTLKATLYDNEYAIRKHATSVSHMVVMNQKKQEKRHILLQEMGKHENEDYKNVITNKYMRMVYLGE